MSFCDPFSRNACAESELLCIGARDKRMSQSQLCIREVSFVAYAVHMQKMETLRQSSTINNDEIDNNSNIVEPMAHDTGGKID